MELAGFASLDTNEHNDLLLHSGSTRWGYWVHHSSLEHCWSFPGVLLDCQSVAGDADYHTIAGTKGVAGTGYTEDTDHSFPS